MKTRFWFLCIVSLGFFSFPVCADVNFEELRCSGGHGLATRIFNAKVQGSNLVFQYESSDMHALLEAIFPEGTPPELSGLYACMELEFKIPASHCVSKAKNLELVTCESENVRLKMTAKNTCYAPTKKKVYEGEATTVAFATKKTSRSGKHYLTQDWNFTLEGKDKVAITDSYIANFWQAESGIGRPACRVDDYVIDYR